MPWCISVSFIWVTPGLRVTWIPGGSSWPSCLFLSESHIILTRLFTKFSLVLLYKSTPSMCFFFYSPLPDDAILCSVKNPLVKQQGFLPTAMTRQRFPGKTLYLLPAFLLDGKLAACPLLIEMQALRLCVFALHSSRSSLFSSPETWL